MKPIMLGIDEIFEERGNQFSRFEKIKWSEDGKECLDVRRYTMDESNEEVPLKGMTFLTPEGPGELAKAIIKNGFGDTEDLLVILHQREDFSVSLNRVVGPESNHYDHTIQMDEMFKPKEVI